MDIQQLLGEHGARTFSFAAEEAEAVSLAREQRPDIIVSDVTLIEGTGPDAVATIRSEHGPLPVLFITATPKLCAYDHAPTRVFSKPLDRLLVGAAFRELAFA